MEKIERLSAELDPVEVPNAQAIGNVKLLSITVKEILKGSNAKTIRDVLKDKGFEVGYNKSYDLIKLAKQRIVRLGERDINVNYSWAEVNLREMHAEAVRDQDDRKRFAALDRLIVIWGLNRPHEEVKETEITPEMIEDFEQKLLR